MMNLLLFFSLFFWNVFSQHGVQCPYDPMGSFLGFSCEWPGWQCCPYFNPAYGEVYCDPILQQITEVGHCGIMGVQCDTQNTGRCLNTGCNIGQSVSSCDSMNPFECCSVSFFTYAVECDPNTDLIIGRERCQSPLTCLNGECVYLGDWKRDCRNECNQTNDDKFCCVHDYGSYPPLVRSFPVECDNDTYIGAETCTGIGDYCNDQTKECDKKKCYKCDWEGFQCCYDEERRTIYEIECSLNVSTNDYSIVFKHECYSAIEDEFCNVTNGRCDVVTDVCQICSDPNNNEYECCDDNSVIFSMNCAEQTKTMCGEHQVCKNSSAQCQYVYNCNDTFCDNKQDGTYCCTEINDLGVYGLECSNAVLVSSSNCQFGCNNDSGACFEKCEVCTGNYHYSCCLDNSKVFSLYCLSDQVNSSMECQFPSVCMQQGPKTGRCVQECSYGRDCGGSLPGLFCCNNTNGDVFSAMCFQSRRADGSQYISFANECLDTERCNELGECEVIPLECEVGYSCDENNEKYCCSNENGDFIVVCDGIEIVNSTECMQNEVCQNAKCSTLVCEVGGYCEFSGTQFCCIDNNEVEHSVLCGNQALEFLDECDFGCDESGCLEQCAIGQPCPVNTDEEVNVCCEGNSYKCVDGLINSLLEPCVSPSVCVNFQDSPEFGNCVEECQIGLICDSVGNNCCLDSSGTHFITYCMPYGQNTFVKNSTECEVCDNTQCYEIKCSDGSYCLDNNPCCEDDLGVMHSVSCEENFLTFLEDCPYGCDMNYGGCIEECVIGQLCPIESSEKEVKACCEENSVQCKNGFINSIDICEKKCKDGECDEIIDPCEIDFECNQLESYCCDNKHLAKCESGKVTNTIDCLNYCTNGNCDDSCSFGSFCFNQDEFCCGDNVFKCDNQIITEFVETCQDSCLNGECIEVEDDDDVDNSISSAALGGIIGGVNLAIIIFEAIAICVGIAIVVFVVLRKRKKKKENTGKDVELKEITKGGDKEEIGDFDKEKNESVDSSEKSEKSDDIDSDEKKSDSEKSEKENGDSDDIDSDEKKSDSDKD